MTRKLKFSWFRIATKLNKEEVIVQVNYLLYAIGKETEAVFNFLAFADTEHTNTYDEVVAKLNEHFVPRTNVIHERACLHQCPRQTAESVKAFVRGLYELEEHCEFKTSKEEQIRDGLVIGIADCNISQTLQMESDMTL